MTKSPDLGIPLLAQSQANPDVTHNEALLLFQALSNGVINMTTTAPPGSPTEGDSYVVGSGATGAWAGYDDHIAISWGGSWRFVPGRNEAGSIIAMGARQEGLTVYNRAASARLVWNGSAWVQTAVSADEVSYDNAVSGLTATDVQAAIDEIVTSLGTAAFEDYEEGTFTPTFSCENVGDLSVSYGDQVGTYSKIGTRCIFDIRLVSTPTFTTANGAARVNGLPFSSLATSGYTSVPNGTLRSTGLTYPAGSFINPFCAANTDYAQFGTDGSGVGFTPINMSDLTSGVSVVALVTGHFKTA